jgi:hypothetical protein
MLIRRQLVFGQFVKVWWMAQWRLSLATFLLYDWMLLTVVLAMATSAILIFGAKRTVLIFPLLRLLLRRPAVQPVAARAGRKPREKTPTQAKPQAVGRQKASTRGRITGYEPKLLAAVEATGKLMAGKPGAGLTSSAFDARAVETGMAGELRFAQAMKLFGTTTQTHLLDRLYSFWSVAMPDAHGRPDRSFGTDVDCVLLSNKFIYLIDVKNYKGGGLRYTASGEMLHATDVATGEPVGEPKLMSKNMAMAVERFTRLFPQHTIIPRVVFMPTDMGAAHLSGVTWPGGIPAVGVDELLPELARAAAGAQISTTAYTATRIRSLVKSEAIAR